ncbi:MAG: hypothetical protein ABIG28_00255 [archaeon]
MPLNKKAQTPTILIFIVALLLCGLTLIAFLIFKSDFNSQSAILSEMMEEITFKEQYIKEQTKVIMAQAIQGCQECSPKDLAEKIKTTTDSYNLQLPDQGNFFGKIREGDFILKRPGGTYILEIGNLFIQSSRGYNKITRPFNLCMEFHPKGEFLGECIISEEALKLETDTENL